jgi:hypothetical protein
MIAAVAASFGALMISAESSQAAPAAETCATSPKGAAPAGSHWYYRTDRTSQRKCWYLASEDGKARRAAAPAQPARPQAETRTPAPPARNEGIARLTQPFESDAPSVRAPSAQQNSEQNNVPASANAFADPAAPVQVPDPAARVAEGSEQAKDQSKNQPTDQPTDQPTTAADGQERVNEAAQPAAPVTEAPAEVQQPTQAVAAPAMTTPYLDADDLRMLPFAIGALAAALLAAGAILYASRRRQDAIVRIVDLNTKAPSRWSSAATAGQPAAPELPYADENEGDGEPRRMPPPWRRRAA